MLNLSDVIDLCRVPEKKKIQLKDFPANWEVEGRGMASERRQVARRLLVEDVQELSTSQELLYAADSWSVLVIFQAMDAAGKDGTIHWLFFDHPN